MIRQRKDPVPLQIDMTPDGRFAGPQPAPVSSKILRLALLVAGVAGVIAIAALALWLALTLIPIAIGAGLIAYGVLRYRMWKSERSIRESR
jgi:hypothetical protein